jgi:FMN-dependent oxidoreductase (nitrilotriacetate monooxygenase family)
MSTTETMHLAADLSHIHTDYLWGAPECWEGYPYYGPEMYEDITRLASAACMDLLFFGDSANTPENVGGNHHASVSLGQRWPKHDMMPLVPLLARAAPGVGFGLTMSTTYHHPFHLARLFSSLDHLTNGRVAWNAVTSAFKNEAANYGFDEMMPPEERYERAQEHMKVAFALWDSVEPDAIVMDRERGLFADPEKVHLINHRGKHFNVRGPLPVMPSPQGRPVIIQAGQSGPGMDLAATYADMQFVSRKTIASMKAHRAQLDAKLAEHGRAPRDVGILWSINIQVAESLSAARDMERLFLDSIPPAAGLLELSHHFGLDFSRVRPDMPIAELADEVREQKVKWGQFEEILKVVDPKMTVTEYARDFVIGQGLRAVGTPTVVADILEELHAETGANGGFILSKGFRVPGYLRDFTRMVVPELQRRGLAKTRYTGATLRENLMQ